MRYVVLIFSKLNLSQYVGLKMVNGKMVGRCVVCRYVAKNANVARRYRSQYCMYPYVPPVHTVYNIMFAGQDDTAIIFYCQG